MTFDEAYNFLNKEQQQAVDTLDGPVLVVAGPGSGKTQLLALRVVNILRNRDVDPENILCLTFTEAGARNMRERLKRFIGTDAYGVGIHTFHGFGMSILQNFPEHILKYHDLIPVDDVRRDEIMEDILRSLRYDNPLRKTGVNGELLYRKPIVNMIGSLKKAGLSPQDFRHILQQNQHDIAAIQTQISGVFNLNLKKKNAISAWEQALHDLLTLPSKEVHTYFDSLIDTYGNSLHRAIEEAQALGKTKPITSWKNTYLKANAQKEKELVDRLYIDKLFQVCDVYQAYQERLAQEGVFDYSDMILQSLTALRSDPSLRDYLQEQYQYLLVDEFQDTNDAQMQLIYLLTQEKSAPNILAVGDDDQGIYKFQGAEISNILSFRSHFPGTQIITLTKNYRSTQEVLDVARQVIVQGKERLENAIDEVDKTLEAAEDHQPGEVKVYEFPYPEQEWTWVVDQVESLLQNGHDPEEIGVIGRGHKDLQALSQYFLARNVPVNYSKSTNILTTEHIHQLITMMEYVDSLTPDKKDRDEVLPEILTYPFWGISRLDIWQFFQTHKRTKRSWIDALESSDNAQFTHIARIFRELALHSLSAPMENIMYSLLGDSQAGVSGLTTPFSEYYISQEQMNKASGVYISIISDIRTLITTIQEYRKNTFTRLSEALEIIEHHRRSEGVYCLTQISNAQKGPHLLTAHGSKGLEFETVCIIQSTQNVWAPKRKGEKLKFPSNMPLNPASDGQDDFLRLYFVALTRAKRNIYITYPAHDMKGKGLEKLSSLSFLEHEKIHLDEDRVVRETWQAESGDHFTSSEKIFLHGVLQDYRITPSHLNAFLDIDYSGPQYMLRQSILGLPQASSPQSSWGNALHHAFHYISRTIQAGYDFPETEEVKHVAVQSLQKEQLYREEVEELEQKLDDILPDLLAHSKSGFYRSHWAEYSFRDLYLTVDDVPITGNIDRIEYDEDKKAITLVDFKTGKAIESWSDNQQKDKLAKFKRQVDFYGELMNEAGFWRSGWSLRGRIDFLEPNDQGEYISLEREITQQDIDFIRTLITCIYGYISRLDFPEIRKYQQQGGAKAQEQFLQDLLDKSV